MYLPSLSSFSNKAIAKRSRNLKELNDASSSFQKTALNEKSQRKCSQKFLIDQSYALEDEMSKMTLSEKFKFFP